MDDGSKPFDVSMKDGFVIVIDEKHVEVRHSDSSLVRLACDVFVQQNHGPECKDVH
jgi:hypothetical protein